MSQDFTKQDLLPKTIPNSQATERHHLRTAGQKRGQNLHISQSQKAFLTHRLEDEPNVKIRLQKIIDSNLSTK